MITEGNGRKGFRNVKTKGCQVQSRVYNGKLFGKGLIGYGHRECYSVRGGSGIK